MVRVGSRRLGLSRPRMENLRINSRYVRNDLKKAGRGGGVTTTVLSFYGGYKLVRSAVPAAKAAKILIFR